MPSSGEEGSAISGLMVVATDAGIPVKGADPMYRSSIPFQGEVGFEDGAAVHRRYLLTKLSAERKTKPQDSVEMRSQDTLAVWSSSSSSQASSCFEPPARMGACVGPLSGPRGVWASPEYQPTAVAKLWPAAGCNLNASPRVRSVCLVLPHLDSSLQQAYLVVPLCEYVVLKSMLYS